MTLKQALEIGFQSQKEFYLARDYWPEKMKITYKHIDDKTFNILHNDIMADDWLVQIIDI